MEDPTDVEKAVKDSKIKYDKNGNLVDVRWQKDIEAYAQWQAGNRQLNRERIDFERMQAKYGENAPYKSLGAFRRASRAGELSPAFKAWRYRNRDEKQYEDWKSKIGAENISKTVDEFQQIKYNNSRGYKQIERDIDLYRQYTETVVGGGVTDVGFAEYKKTLTQATEQIVGTTTSDGRKIASISKHLVDRIIGSESESRKGVSIEKVIECLQKGEIVKRREKSIKYFFDNVEVSFNPVTNNVIQCNPKTRKKK